MEVGGGVGDAGWRDAPWGCGCRADAWGVLAILSK